MTFRKSIRWRIQAWHGLLLLGMTTAFAVTAWRLERTNAYRRFDDDLKSRLGVLGGALERGGPRRSQGGDPRGGGPDDDLGGEPPDGPPDELPPPPRGPGGGPPPAFSAPEVTAMFKPDEAVPFYYQVWTRKGEPLTGSSTAPTGIIRPSGGSLDPKSRVRDGFRECYHFTPPGECILVGRSSALVDQAMRDFAFKTAGIGGGLLSVGLAVGWWISSRALRPISAISAAAARISKGHLKERIETSETESELGKLASLLDDTFRRLDAAFDEQARFTSDAAHELRTPVSIILAQSQLALSRDREPAFYRETIEASQRAARRMQGLIESLLQLAVLDAAAGNAEFHPGDLSKLGDEHLPALRVLAEEKGSVIVANLQSAWCRMNAEQVGQILDNFVSNAVKYSPSGSEIHVTSGVRGDRAFLSVRDNGPGIAAEHQPHVFERFFRTDSSRSSATGGTGLGLAICKRIADAHDGTLSVQSEEGKGSIFIFDLPSFMLG